MTFTALLEWWNFIFALPLAAGLLLGLGLALSGLIDDLGHSDETGAGTHDGHIDIHDIHDVDTGVQEVHTGAGDSHDAPEGNAHDTESNGGHVPILPHESHPELVKSHEGDSGSSPLTQLMALFGLGIGLPLSLGFPTLMILWGASGLIANGLLSPLLRLPALYVPVSILLSIIMMAVGGRMAALTFRRAAGNNQPLAVKRGGLVGSTGYAAFEINSEGGVANVKDPFGNVHRVVCRTLPGNAPVEAGTGIIIVRFEPEAGLYYVEENPFEGNLRLSKAQDSGLTGEQTLNQQQ